MTDILHRVREYIQDPNRTTSMNKYRPRQNPLPPPASEELIQAAERRLGFPLPQLLRDFYMYIANGHFGPGYGFFQITDPPRSLFHPGAPDLLAMNAENQRAGMLFICDWGCEHYSCVDCLDPLARVEFYIGYGDEYILHNQSFNMWIEDWLTGVDLWEQMMGASRIR